MTVELVFAVLKERDGSAKIRGSIMQLLTPPPPACCHRCCNDLQKSCSANSSQISVAAKQQEAALLCEYTVAAMLFCGPESPPHVLESLADGKGGQTRKTETGANTTRAECFTGLRVGRKCATSSGL
jgi:hypothetical protein